jgi:tetratricopeptide (TPR) repeat protein
LTEAWQRQRLYEALARAVLGENQSLLLALDDLQWSDQETLEWLHYLLRFDSGAPLLVVATLRLGEVPDNHPVAAFVLELRRDGVCTDIELGPLDEAQTATLAAHVAGQAYAPGQAAQLFQDTEGNPLFVVETVRAGVDGGNQEPESGEEDVSPVSRPPVSVSPVLPPRVQAVIEARLAQLSPSTRELAGLAAAIGRAFTLDVLVEASHEDEMVLVQSLDELWARRIIRDQGADVYDFSHDKLREVIYASLSAARRRLLHRQVAQALETLYVDSLDTVSGQIAAHLEGAGALYRAFHYYERAAQHATSIYAHREAARLYSQAIRTARQLNWPGPELAKLYAARGRVLEHAGQFADAVQTYRDLERLAGERDDKAMECLAVARLVACYIEPNDVHDLEQAKPLIERGLALAREAEEYEQEAHLLWSKMVQATHYGHSEQAQEAGEACIAIARQHGLHARLAYALHDLALNLRLSGKLAQGTAYAAEARRLFRELGNRPMLADNLGQQALIDYLQSDFDAALQSAVEAAKISQEISNGWNISFATWIQGLVWEARGEWGQAQARWEEATARGRDVGFLMALTAIPTQLGAMLRELGQIEGAQALHQQAHDASQRLAPFMLRAVESQLALDAIAAGEVNECERWLCQAHAREPLGEIGTALLLTYPASAAVGWAEAGGDWDFALAAVEDALEQANRRHLAVHQTHLAYERGRCLAGLGRASDAEECFLQALARAEESGLQPLQRRVHTALVSLYAAHGRTAELETHRVAAAELSQLLSDSLTVPNQRRSFLSTPAVRAVLKAQPLEKPALAGS